MSLVLNGSGTITGATTLASTVTSPTLTTPVITSTLGVGGATPSASGAGITFPATQSASTDANTLDDYEEGTWTPTLIATGTPPTITSYSTQTGTYTKIGNLVVVTCTIRATLSAIGSGVPVVRGLPFAPSGYLDGVSLGLRTLITPLPTTGMWVSGPNDVYFEGSAYTTSSQSYLTFTVSYRVA